MPIATSKNNIINKKQSAIKNYGEIANELLNNNQN